MHFYKKLIRVAGRAIVVVTAQQRFVEDQYARRLVNTFAQNISKTKSVLNLKKCIFYAFL
jgi:hypothetical protein